MCVRSNPILLSINIRRECDTNVTIKAQCYDITPAWARTLSTMNQLQRYSSVIALEGIATTSALGRFHLVLLHCCRSCSLSLVPPPLTLPGKMDSHCSTLEPLGAGCVVELSGTGVVVEPSGTGVVIESSIPGFVFEPSGVGVVIELSGVGSIVELSGAGSVVEPSPPGFIFEPSGTGVVVEPSGAGVVIELSGAGVFVELLGAGVVEGISCAWDSINS